MLQIWTDQFHSNENIQLSNCPLTSASTSTPDVDVLHQSVDVDVLYGAVAHPAVLAVGRSRRLVVDRWHQVAEVALPVEQLNKAEVVDPADCQAVK